MSSFPDLAKLIYLLSSAPHCPASMNLLSILLVPFLPDAGVPSPLPVSWDSVLSYYPSSAFHVYPQGIDVLTSPNPWAVFLSRPSQAMTKLNLYFNKPSESHALLEQIISSFKSPSGDNKTIFYIAGLEEVLLPTFEKEVGTNLLGNSLSWKLAKPLSETVKVREGLRPLDKKYEMSIVREDEIESLLRQSGRSNPVTDFTEKLIHISSCIRLKETGVPVSWCMVYDDLSIAALQTVPEHLRQSLASYVILNLGAVMTKAFELLPKEITLAQPTYLAADTNDGNPKGEGFFMKEGWERTGDGREGRVSWAKASI